MAAPYVVLCWPTDCDDAARRVASVEGWFLGRGWRIAFADHGLQVWGPRDRSPPIRRDEAQDALIIGRIYTLGPGVARALDGSATVVARAEHLCRALWGAYVALWRDAKGELWALRDPSGAVDAFAWRRGELRLLASDLADAPTSLHPADLAIDWRAVEAQLTEVDALAFGTALQGVQAICPGDLQCVGAAQSTPIWRPGAFGPDDGAADPGEAERLAETVIATVGALVRGYDRVLTELSGGLDSSIVNAAIGAAGLGGRVAAAVHYVGDRRESDERAWADAVAGRWSLPLETAARAVDVIDPERDFAPLAGDARPPVGALDAWRDRDMAQRMAAHGAQAVITGIGGDAVFFQMATAKVVADLWAAQGLRAWRHPIVLQTARWLRRSVWSVGAEAIRGPGAKRQVTGRGHPWLADLAEAPPAKQLQLIGLVAVQRAHGRCRRSAIGDLVHPLIAQPVVEACLAIPSWRLVRGGRDRGLARDAFASLLPASVMMRASKGGLTSLFSRRVAASLDVLRPYLLDGVLAEAGLLDRAALERALDPDHLIWRADGVSLVTAAAIEAWARRWQTRAPDAAGAPRRPVARA